MKTKLAYVFAVVVLAVAVMMIAVPTKAALPVQPSFAPLVKKTSPAVVNIYTKRVVRERARVMTPFFNDPFFSQFFNAPPTGGMVRERLENSLGSGVIVDENGIIATNNHVIKDATEINVVMSDGREFTAQKLLGDARTDLAILKIDTRGEKLPVLELTDSDMVEVGDIVLAIGNPFGVGQTVTSGIVSGLARTDVGISDYSFFIQTDAAINPGNSGGALIDTQGRLIGINSAIFSRTGGSLGIGFAIPANMLRVVVDSAQNSGKIVRPWTGLSGQHVTADMVESLGLPRAYGALANKVRAKSPADRAGVKVGDVILEINGRVVQDPEALKFRLATVPLGSMIQLKLWRGGQEVLTEMAAEPPPEDPPREETEIKGTNLFAGARVANISPALIEEVGYLERDSGVVIIDAGVGTAGRLGLRRGDVILSVNDREVTSVQQMERLLRSDSKHWRAQIVRGGRVINVVIGG